jgi:hypothetical protein
VRNVETCNGGSGNAGHGGQTGKESNRLHGEYSRIGYVERVLDNWLQSGIDGNLYTCLGGPESTSHLHGVMQGLASSFGLRANACLLYSKYFD